MRSSARAASSVAPGARPREDFGHAVFAAGDHGGRKMMRAGDDVGDDLGRHRIRHGRLKHADDRALRAPPKLSSRTVLPITPGSECSESSRIIGEHDRAGGVGAVVGRSQQAAEHRPQAHHVEVVAVDDSGGNFARRAEANDGEVDAEKVPSS